MSPLSITLERGRGVLRTPFTPTTGIIAMAFEISQVPFSLIISLTMVVSGKLKLCPHLALKLSFPHHQSSQSEVVVPLPTVHLIASKRISLESRIPFQMWEPPFSFVQFLGLWGILYLFFITLIQRRSFSFITRQPSLKKARFVIFNTWSSA